MNQQKEENTLITQRPKGTQDWYGESMQKRTVLEKMARDLCKVYNIKEVITPVFEHTELFQRGVGETTDVVQKEMYTFTDKGDRSISLKPKGTAVLFVLIWKTVCMQKASQQNCFMLHQHFVMKNHRVGV